MSDFFGNDNVSADEPQFKTIEELIREIRAEKEAAGEPANGAEEAANAVESTDTEGTSFSEIVSEPPVQEENREQAHGTEEEANACESTDTEGVACSGTVSETLFRGEANADALEEAGADALEEAGADALEEAGANALEEAGADALEEAGADALEEAGADALEEADTDALDDEQSYYADLDWNKVDEISRKKLAGSNLNWDIKEEKEVVPRTTLADLELKEGSLEEAVPVVSGKAAEPAAEESGSDAEPAQENAAKKTEAAEPEAAEESGSDVEPAQKNAAEKTETTEQEAAEEAGSDTEPAQEITAEKTEPTDLEATEEAGSDAKMARENAAEKTEAAETDSAEEAGSDAETALENTVEKAETAEPEAAQEKPKRRKGVRLVSVLITALLLAVLFVAIFNISYKVDYDNLGGTHCWLSASTIKFVNNWLEETPLALHFTNYGGMNSVEYQDLASREAYVSYPTGTTLFVYLGAKITGHDRIDINFLKHFQMIWYYLESVLLAWFVMLLAGGSGYRSESGKVVIGFMTGALWILMPVNLWYLSNVYFADQCVILWVMLFLPVEYIIRVQEKGGWINGEDIFALSRAENRKRLRDGHASIFLLILRFVIIYTGMLIDYYFWVLVFMSFFTEFIGDLLNKRGFGRAVRRSMGYVLPVLAGILTFRWQVNEVENWRELLFDRFLFRTTDSTAGLEEVRGFFRSTFTADSEEMMQWMIYYNLAMLVLAVVYLLFHRPTRLFKSSQCSILLTGLGAIVFHTLLLKQHSGVHEFSQIKVSWWIAIMPAVAAILILKVLSPEFRSTGKSWNPNLSWLMLFFMLTFSASLYITQIPSVDASYYHFRDQMESYPIEETIRDNTGYRDVCFSFTYEIPKTPPMRLAVSGKKVYKINSLDDINELFPDLWMDNGRLLMVVEKAGADQLTEEQNDQLYEIYSDEYVIADNSSCTIFEINDWTGQF